MRRYTMGTSAWLFRHRPNAILSVARGLTCLCAALSIPLSVSHAGEGRVTFTVGATLTDLPPVMQAHETVRTTQDREWHLIPVGSGAAYDFIITE